MKSSELKSTQFDETKTWCKDNANKSISQILQESYETHINVENPDHNKLSTSSAETSSPGTARLEVTTPPDARTGDSGERPIQQNLSEGTKPSTKLESFKAKLLPLDIEKLPTSEKLVITSHEKESMLEQKPIFTHDEQHIREKFGDFNLQEILKRGTLNELHTVKGLFEKIKIWDIKKKQSEGHENEEVKKVQERYDTHIDAIQQTIGQKKAESTGAAE